MKEFAFSFLFIFILNHSVCFGNTSKAMHVKTNILLSSNGLEKFKQDIGRYPTQLEGLQALRYKPDVLQKWNGPYVKDTTFIDVWGEPYVYIYPPIHSGEKFDLYSYGENRIDDNCAFDDITYWKDINCRIYRCPYKTSTLIICALFLLCLFLFAVWISRQKN